MKGDKMYKNIQIYSDGSCLGNPGPGGWASILKYGESERMISGGDPSTTNNRMELLGVINGIKELRYKCNVEIITDSSYVVNAFNNGWIYKWEKQGFRNRANSDLWKTLLEYVRLHNEVQFKWVKGHAGDKYNEICDKEAQRQASLFRRGQ